MTPGDAAKEEARRRVAHWSLRIHDFGDERHTWALEASEAIWAGRLPEPFPSPYKSTRAARLETVARLMEVPVSSLAQLAVQLHTAGREPEAEAIEALRQRVARTREHPDEARE